MIEKIFYKKKLYALIVNGKYRNKKGINFFTPNYTTQQFAYINHRKNYVIKPHKHKKRLTKILSTTEVVLILKGILRVDFYNLKKKYLFSKLLRKNDIILLVHGAHGFKVIKNVQMLEVKQGPYSAVKDKIKFENVDEKKIKYKKN